MKLLDVAQQKYLDHMEGRKYPACFESEVKFEAWAECEAIAHTKPRALPCRDCSIEYHSQMAKEGRCAVAEVPKITRIMVKACVYADPDAPGRVHRGIGTAPLRAS